MAYVCGDIHNSKCTLGQKLDPQGAKHTVQFSQEHGEDECGVLWKSPYGCCYLVFLVFMILGNLFYISVLGCSPA